MFKKQTKVKVFFAVGIILLVLMVGCSQVLDAYVLSQGVVAGYAAGSMRPEEKVAGELPEAKADTTEAELAGRGTEPEEETPLVAAEQDTGNETKDEQPEEVKNEQPQEAKPATVKKTEPKKTIFGSTAAKEEVKPVETETKPVQTVEEEAQEEPQEKPAPEPQPEKEAEVVAPVAYKWGSARTFSFRSEVILTNTGSEVSNNIRVLLPMLENHSPYQKTVLKSTSQPVTATEGRVGTFVIESLQPGETQTIVTNYTITVRPVSISSTNETVEKARVAFNKYAGSGNCHTLAVGFVNETRAMGLKARVVTGFKRKDRGDMTSGSLQGCRHSWAEFYVDGLGWVPVDLTFKYFANFPQASHIVETYADLSIKIRYKGGDISAVWKNSVL